MPGVPPDGIDKLKSAIKSLFKKSKKPAEKEGEKPTPTKPAAAPAAGETSKPTETKPADPAPATAPDVQAATASAGDAAPAEPIPAEGEVKKEGEVAPETTLPTITTDIPATTVAAPETIETDAPATNGIDAKPAAAEVMPTPATKPPAEGMSATSGPLDDNPHMPLEAGEEVNEETKPTATS